MYLHKTCLPLPITVVTIRKLVVRTIGTRVQTAGVDFGRYPSARMFTVGISAMHNSKIKTEKNSMKKIFLTLSLTFHHLIGLWSCKKSFFDASSVDGSINDASAFKSQTRLRNGPDWHLCFSCWWKYRRRSLGNRAGWISQDWVDNTLKPKEIEIIWRPGNHIFWIIGPTFIK
jgi:hypothetical protein